MKQLSFFLLAGLTLMSSACNRTIEPIERQSLQPVTNVTTFTKASRVIHIGQGDFLIVGSRKSAQGDFDLYVARYNLANGNIWEQVIANVGEDLGLAITYSNGFCYATANSDNNESMLVKLDAATGAVILRRQIADITNCDIAINPNEPNFIYLAGSTTDVDTNKPAFDATNDLTDIHLEKLDDNFNRVWLTVAGFNRLEDNPRLHITNNQTVVLAKSQYNDANNLLQEQIFICKFISGMGGILNQQSYSLNTNNLQTYNIAPDINNPTNVNSITQDIQGNTYVHNISLGSANNNIIQLASSSNINTSGNISNIANTTQGYLIANNTNTAAYINLINNSSWANQNTTDLSATNLGLSGNNSTQIGEGTAFINSSNTNNFVYPITVNDGVNSYITLVVIDQYGTIQPQ
jgi:phage FluMu protein gp41